MDPNMRRRLQQCFETGSKAASKGEFDYAVAMFTQCISGDPGNLIYVQNFVGNLQRMYGNNKRGVKMATIRTAGGKSAVTKSRLQKDWAGVLKSGIEVLKSNPWDTSTLTNMAEACEHLGHDDCQLFYLKSALDYDIKDPDINRTLGKAMERQGQFDQAIIAWSRVLQANPKEEEASRKISNLQLKKTIKEGGYEDADTSTQVMVDKDQQEERQGGGARNTPEQRLEKLIAKNPAEISNYIELAELYLRTERFELAEQAFERALSVSGGDVNLRERLEDTQLRRYREQVAVAERRVQEQKSDEAKQLHHKLWAELNNKELEIYRTRMDRYPTNLVYRYEVAERLKRNKQFKEAIPFYQKALADTRRKGNVLLALGECFQQIEQYKLAMTNYESAIQELSERDGDEKKLCLYRAGKLALGLKELDSAERHLTALAGLDFGYRDVPELLDKVKKLRNNA